MNTRAPKPSLAMVVFAFESCSSGSVEIMSVRVNGLRLRFDPDVDDENYTARVMCATVV